MKQKILLIFLLCSGCMGSKLAFDLAPTSENFLQNDLQSSNTIDILWVVDNSLSMQTSQDNLRANFDSFLNQFSSRNMDFQMAVTTTEAYRTVFNGDPLKSEFRSGSAAGVMTGYKIITPATPDFRDNMLINLDQGIAGSGDERAFQSFATALTNPLNNGFIRPKSFLAIIILSDEDDFSSDFVTNISGQYSHPDLHSIQRYRTQLDALTGSTPDYQRYSVSAIAIRDNACLTQLLAGSSGQKIGQRYMELATATNGIVASLCGNFADSLNQISSRILELFTGFKLDRTPKPDSISVSVDGHSVIKDAVNGWTYDSQRNMILFHGLSIPGRAAFINVSFQPIDPRR